MSTTTTTRREAIPPLWSHRAHPHQVISLVAALSAIAALTADARPTTSGVADVLLLASVGAVVPFAASVAPRWSWLASAGLAGMFASGGWLLVVALVGLALTLSTIALGRRPRLVGAVVGLAVIQVALRFPDIGPHGLPSLIAAVVIGLLVVSGYRYASHSTSRVTRRVGVGLAIVAVVVVASSVLGLLQARSRANLALDAARRGLEAARGGDQEAAIANLELAVSSFGRASASVDAWWAQPGRVLPVISQHLEAADRAAHAGEEVAETAAVTVRAADLSAIKATDGRVDLDLVRSIKAPLELTVDAIVAGRSDVESAQSPWLLPPIGDRLDELLAELDDAEADAELAVAAAEVLPAMLGGDAPRRYLVLFGNPAESRELGGIVGNVAELTVADGRIELGQTLRNSDLNRGGLVAMLSEPQLFPTRYQLYEPATFSQNLTGMVDFPSVALAVADLYPQLGGSPINGVLYLDPHALAALLRLTGPVQVPDLVEPLTARNAASFLLRDQYVQFPEKSARVDFLSDAAERTFDALLRADLPGPAQLAASLETVVEEDRLVMWTFEHAEQDFLRDVGLAGGFPPTALDGSDLLSVVQADAAENKMDAYLTRAVDYDVVHDPGSGRVTSTVTVELRNDAPADLPDYVVGTPPEGSPAGTIALALSVYSPLQLVDVFVNGEPEPVELRREFGLGRYLVFVDVEPDMVSRVRFGLSGVVAPGAEYGLLVAGQPLANPDSFTVDVTDPSGRPTVVVPSTGGDSVAAGAPVAARGDFHLIFRHSGD